MAFFGACFALVHSFGDVKTAASAAVGAASGKSNRPALCFLSQKKACRLTACRLTAAFAKQAWCFSGILSLRKPSRAFSPIDTSRSWRQREIPGAETRCSSLASWSTVYGTQVITVGQYSLYARQNTVLTASHCTPVSSVPKA